MKDVFPDMEAEIQVFQKPAELVEGVKDEILRAGRQALQEHGRFSLVLAGGSTPRPVYQKLAAVPATVLDWSRVHFFWGDERCVPPDHPDSNFRMTQEALLDHIPIPEANIHRMAGEVDPSQAAENYERDLRSFFKDSTKFDLVLLGMGDDGHTASLFPGLEAIHEGERWTVSLFVPKLDTWRITLTPAILNQAKQVLFMVAGVDKATALKQILEGNFMPDQYPAQIIQPQSGTLTWMVDAAAAANLSD